MSFDIRCHDTICALSSAQGPAALAIIRACGPRAEAIFNALFKPKRKRKLRPFVALYGTVCDHENRAIDECVGVYFPDQRSFSGEPSFEIYCHGNMLIVDEIIQAICAQGARLAQRGEFSLRALLNGKIDLAQAESIADLIHAQSPAAKNAALTGLQGALAKRCLALRENIIVMLAEIEARMDFPDDDLGSYDHSAIAALIDTCLAKLDKLLDQAAYSIKLHEGVRVVICGAPNAGKSTLLNYLCGHERALVHECAGTTRDVIEARIDLNGVAVTIVDIAGIREHGISDPVELLGIERAYEEIADADIVLWLADSTLAEPFNNKLIQTKLEHCRSLVRVLTKGECYQAALAESALVISAKTGLGIDELLAHLHKIVTNDHVVSGDLFITRARQRDELMLAHTNLQQARESLHDGWADEVITSQLRQAGLCFDRLFGSELNEDILDAIFENFCIGK